MRPDVAGRSPGAAGQAHGAPGSSPAGLPAGSPSGAWEASVGGTRILFGTGRLLELGAAARALGGRRVLIVTDPGVAAAGHADQAVRALQAERIDVELFDGVEENPTTLHVARGVERASGWGPDLIVGLGGGSAMDCAKGINLILTNGGTMEDYWGSHKTARPLLPAIGVPTTAGTGSEAQSYALIEQEGSRRKMACGDETARFRTVILDPELTTTQPRGVAAASGMDAISHVVESHVTTRRNPISTMFSLRAWGLLSASFERALADPSDTMARGGMLLGAHMAGAAIESSMLGAAHACANPLTSRYGIAHGAAVLLMLPHVVRFNASAARVGYGELVAADQGDTAGIGAAAPAEALAARLVAMRAVAGLPDRLGSCGVDRDLLAALAAEAAGQWTVRFNPRPAGTRELLELYESAW
ncbi:MAG TPA: iron-containing alcohol dehydrogenase [Candidatus Polarisedimenticolia bacterium]|nr:iron-containing alcohol dehydrogenase [Candidatus Polarisedimenticolia bacterium]